MVALCIGVEGDSPARMATSRGRSRSLMGSALPSLRRACVPGVCTTWDSFRRHGGYRPRRPAAAACGPRAEGWATMRRAVAVLAALLGTLTMVAGCGDDGSTGSGDGAKGPKGIEGALKGGTPTPDRERGDGPGGPGGP